MSIIVPAGNKNVEWSPKEEPMVKTASTATDVKEEVSPLYEAAKTFIEASERCKDCNKPKGLCECKKEEPKAELPNAACADDKAPIVEIETPEGEKAEGDAKEKIEVALDKLEEVVVDLKDAVQQSDVAEEAEIEIEVEDNNMPEIPGKDVSQSDIIVESTPACACAETKKEVKEAKKEDKNEKKEDKKEEKKEEKKEVVMDKSAATEEEFCKFAKLTPANRQKLAKYWKDALGYPADYVSLMVKDYEK